MLLIVTYSPHARQTLRNACRSHTESVVRRFGRAALFTETEYSAFLACRLRARHGADVQVERTRPFNEFLDVPEEIRTAATAYERRETPSTPYDKFAVGTEYPSSESMRTRKL
ncbi:hypothetical protein [Haloquadratum walsbyi]|uniref:Uncharacterized protein n=1 Tax=Haloquadratum walsbyi J07HQW2 TaxID=1238425 RepID=U1PTX5_9EURY|nr:hypothetical protein [Haloquadratum walsbyi]ERG95836.1 MAG: hypothetical protein J07HQW2_02296 [Haloquadratum walsbyi J07HQW2]